MPPKRRGETTVEKRLRVPPEPPQESARLPPSLEVWLKVQEFRRTRNSVLAIEALLLAKERRIPPPPTAYDAVLGWLRRWHDSQATLSLDEAFGITGGKGKRHPYRALLLEERNEKLFLKVAALKILGTSTERAAEIVCGGLEAAQGWNTSRWPLRAINATTLAQSYSKQPERRGTEEWMRAEMLTWSPEKICGFLNQFPSDHLTYRLKEILRDPSKYLKKTEREVGASGIRTERIGS